MGKEGRRKFTAEEELTISEMWVARAPVHRIAARLLASVDMVKAAKARLRLPPRERVVGESSRYRDPTPAEIEERAALERAAWSPDVELKRRWGTVAPSDGRERQG